MAAVATTLVISNASVVHADPDPSPGQQQFVTDLASVGIVPVDPTQGNQALVNKGEFLCSEMSGGKTREYETNVVRGQLAGVTPSQGAAIVNFAVQDLCPTVPQNAGHDQASAEKAVRDGYLKKQAACTPGHPGNVRSITWDAPGFNQTTGGTGTINDVTPGLGGPFIATYGAGQWDIEYQFC
jgi:hypothetical protein